MKVIVDNAIPFIENRISNEVDLAILPGKDIDAHSVKDADALVVRTRTKCNAGLLKGSKVKLVATATIGTDHIDIDWCNKNGINVMAAPGCNAPGVAQYVLASLLETGFDPKSQTLGVIGYGNVGHVVVDWAKQMGFKTLVSDEPRKRSGFNDMGYCSLEYLLRRSDAVTLHVPLTYSGDFPTRYLIGEKELNLMKRGAILVNSSRGGVVDEKALKEKLKRCEIKAIIDVWENEPTIDPELVRLAEISTPHIAGYSQEGKKRATKMVLQALNKVLGIPVNTDNLIEDPEKSENSLIDNPDKHDGNKITPEIILTSYSPSLDSRKLKSEISSFELLRNNYPYRSEP